MAPVLILKRKWADLILEGTKTIEVRGTSCPSKVNRDVYIYVSGSSQISGFVRITQCEGPVDVARFRSTEHLHLLNRDSAFLQGMPLPYKRTYLWHLSDATLIEPFPFQPPRGAIVWTKFI